MGHHFGQKSRFYYEPSKYIMKGRDSVMNGRDILWQVEILLWTGEIFMMTGWDFIMNAVDFHDRVFYSDWSRFYEERLTFSWCQVEIFMTAGRDIYSDDSSRFSWWQVNIFMMYSLQGVSSSPFSMHPHLDPFFSTPF